MRTAARILFAIAAILIALSVALFVVSHRIVDSINWTPLRSAIDLTKGTSIRVSFRPDYSAIYQLSLRLYTNISLEKFCVPVETRTVLTNSAYPEYSWMQNHTTTHQLTATSYTNKWLDEVQHYMGKDRFILEYSVITSGKTIGTGIISNDNIRGWATDYIQGQITNLNLAAGTDYQLTAKVREGTGVLNKERPTLALEIDPLVFKGRYVIAQIIALPAIGFSIVGLACAIIGAILHLCQRKG